MLKLVLFVVLVAAAAADEFEETGGKQTTVVRQIPSEPSIPKPPMYPGSAQGTQQVFRPYGAGYNSISSFLSRPNIQPAVPAPSRWPAGVLEQKFPDQNDVSDILGTLASIPFGFRLPEYHTESSYYKPRPQYPFHQFDSAPQQSYCPPAAPVGLSLKQQQDLLNLLTYLLSNQNSKLPF
ncbi:uncharacterized protein LOC132195842 [Neocloeon triangulifer]|uniref:uncharacterized protein LOC132195842 n=1 Tax=Neocloeon triangulifer TaxID=2078957 RepID=UPI00286F352D|nr:uncharacterized protein LOC132195842 [Neocloeon triangulifer]